MPASKSATLVRRQMGRVTATSSTPRTSATLHRGHRRTRTVGRGARISASGRKPQDQLLVQPADHAGGQIGAFRLGTILTRKPTSSQLRRAPIGIRRGVSPPYSRGFGSDSFHSRRCCPIVADQPWMVKPALMAPTCAWYAPNSTCGLPVPWMSPGVTASFVTGNGTWTVSDWPGSRLTLVNPTRR